MTIDVDDSLWCYFGFDNLATFMKIVSLILKDYNLDYLNPAYAKFSWTIQTWEINPSIKEPSLSLSNTISAK